MQRNNLNETKMTYILFTQPVWTLTAGTCFDFSFRLGWFGFVFK